MILIINTTIPANFLKKYKYFKRNQHMSFNNSSITKRKKETPTSNLANILCDNPSKKFRDLYFVELIFYSTYNGRSHIWQIIVPNLNYLCFSSYTYIHINFHYTSINTITFFCFQLLDLNS